jgi:hypothetical protein
MYRFGYAIIDSFWRCTSVVLPRHTNRTFITAPCHRMQNYHDHNTQMAQPGTRSHKSHRTIGARILAFSCQFHRAMHSIHHLESAKVPNDTIRSESRSKPVKNKIQTELRKRSKASR